MIRALLPAVLLALAAAPSAAQKSTADPKQTIPSGISGIQSVKSPNPPQITKQPVGGVQSAADPKAGADLLDAALIAALRARHEQAKANGQLSPARMARQAERLAILEAQLAAQQDRGSAKVPGKSMTGGVTSAGSGKH